MELRHDNLESPEQEKTVPRAWLFDVDGVLTDPVEKRVINQDIITHLEERISRKEPVALITGRDIQWVITRVVEQLEDRLSDRTLLDSLYISGEFGGSYMTYENGERNIHINPDISVSQDIIRRSREILLNSHADSMFFDESKKTMVSIEMRDGFSVDEFRESQHALIKKLNELLEADQTHNLEVHADTIATNIRDRRANKSYAVTEVLDWLRKMRVKPERFEVFGDSLSDIEMPNELSREGKKVEFIFVGKPEILEGRDLPYPVTNMGNTYSSGTLEYLQSVIK